MRGRLQCPAAGRRFGNDAASRARRSAIALVCGFLAACGSEEADRDVEAAAAVPVQQQPGAATMTEQAASAVDSIRQVSIESYPEVPLWAKRRFQELGCSVPQAFHSDTPHNVISGEFAAPGQVDWAALCSRGDSAAIVVAWGGNTSCPTPLAQSAKRDFVQMTGNGRFGFSRALGVVTMETILRLAGEFDGPEPPSRDHEGIDDYFVDKASTIRYCHGDRWYVLVGVD